jgi:hypothetical protein
MNKKILYILLLIIVPSYAFSQRFNGGILAGINASQVDGDNYAGYNKFGFAVGVFISTELSDRISGEIQLRYMQKGANKKITDLDPSLYISKLHYIELPLLLRFKLNNKISYHVGPGIGYLFKSTQENEYGFLNPPDGVKFKSFELCGIAGFNYKIYKNLAISVSFSYSILPIANHTNNQTYYLNRGSYNNLFTTVFYYQL